MKYLSLIMLFAVSTSFAENVTFIGRDSQGAIIRKDVSINEPDARKKLGDLRSKMPDLTWSVTKEGEADYDIAVPKPESPRERYQKVTTVEEKLAIVEEILNLK